MVYNYQTDSWEIFWSEENNSDEPYGWDVWEEWNFNESNWPDLSNYPIIARNLQIDAGMNTAQNGGNEQKNMGSAPYSTTWYGRYFYWEVSQ
jgi:hypothetical protein